MQLATQIAERSEEKRVDQWKRDIEFDFHHLAEWIKLDCGDDRSSPFNASSPHPQLQAQEAAEKWAALWNPPVLPQVNALDDLCDFLPDLHFPCEVPYIQGYMLQKFATKQ